MRRLALAMRQAVNRGTSVRQTKKDITILGLKGYKDGKYFTLNNFLLYKSPTSYRVSKSFVVILFFMFRNQIDRLKRNIVTHLW